MSHSNADLAARGLECDVASARQCDDCASRVMPDHRRLCPDCAALSVKRAPPIDCPTCELAGVAGESSRPNRWKPELPGPCEFHARAFESRILGRGALCPRAVPLIGGQEVKFLDTLASVGFAREAEFAVKPATKRLWSWSFGMLKGERFKTAAEATADMLQCAKELARRLEAARP